MEGTICLIVVATLIAAYFNREPLLKWAREQWNSLNNF